MQGPPKPPRRHSDGGAVDILSDEFLYEWAVEQSEPVIASPTGLQSWDQACEGPGDSKGLPVGYFVTIGGNPGFGKTMLMLNIAERAVAAGLDVMIVTLEMLPPRLASRFYRLATGINPQHDIGRGEAFDRLAFDKMRGEVQGYRTGKGRLMVNRAPITGIHGVANFMHWAHEEHGCPVYMVDYMQLAGQGSEDSIHKQTVEIAGALRTFAHLNRVLVVGLSQFHRKTSENYHDTPRSQGLYGGMSLEASSDQVFLLDHSRYDSVPGKPKARTWGILDKNRDGPKNIHIPLSYDFRDLSVREAIAYEEWPKHKSNGRY